MHPFHRGRLRRLGAALTASGALAAAVAAPVTTAAAAEPERGNVIFLHPDGTGPNHWGAARAFWAGPDGNLQWDRLAKKALYRGHMKDVIYSSSNAAATTHAFGFKFERAGSFGKDGDGASARTIDALSGYSGSLMRQAANTGHPVGVVNDGTVTEPGTGAFLAEVGNRNDHWSIALQMLTGRPGEDDSDPQVIMGAGEQWFLPAPTAAQLDDPDARTNGYHGWGSRTDGRDLMAEARARGYRVIRTRLEFRQLLSELTSRRCRQDPARADCAPKVLGLFAREDTYNDVTEEQLISRGLRIPGRPESAKAGNLLLYGTWPGVNNPDPTIPVGQRGANGVELTVNGHNPPTFAEMTQLALRVLERRADDAGKPFMYVGEPESTDNFSNENNAIGALVAMKRADDGIGVARRYLRSNPDTLVMNAADGDASGMQVLDAPRGANGSPGNAGTVSVNPTGIAAQNVQVPADGRYGRNTVGFETEPDQFGQRLPFSILWVGPDVLGGMVVRADGLNAGLLDRARFSRRFDNVDVYRVMHRTLLGELPTYPEGEEAPTRTP